MASLPWIAEHLPEGMRTVASRPDRNWIAIGFYSCMGLWAFLVLLRSLGMIRW